MGMREMTRSEFRFWPDRENATYRRQTDVGVYDSFPLAYAGGAARRRAVSLKEVAASAGAYTGRDRAWLVPDAVMPDGLTPRPGDQLRDSDNVDWTVGEVQTGKFGNTHRCLCRALAVVNELSATGTLSRPDNTQDAAGRMALTSYAAVGSVACRVQPQDSAAADVFDRRTTPLKYVAYLATPLAARAKDRFTVGGVAYTVEGFRNPERVWDLMALDLTLVG